MPVYIINEHEVTDPVAFERYPALAAPSIVRGGGRILARSERSEALEGSPSKRVILLEFPDKATAMRWYNSADYKAAKDLRHASATSRVILVEGTQPA